MIDRVAEGLHCGELGQGVALLYCLLSSIFLHDSFLVTDGYLLCHCQMLIIFSDCFSASIPTLCSSLSCCALISLILRSLGHFCFTWSYLNVMILSPQLTPNLLSTELQYSLLIQITLNPPIAAVSRKSDCMAKKLSEFEDRKK